MTWHLPTQVYTMPSAVDLPGESSPDYNSDNIVSQNNYMFPQSVDHQKPLAGRYNVSPFPYFSQATEVAGYCQQQYTVSTIGQQQSYRDNSFVWIGANNFYPSSSYDQRYPQNSYNIQRQNLRRHASTDRSDKNNIRKRRAPTIAQRRAANIRERRRMYNLNEAFDCLRQRIPTFAYEKRLSRIETLRLAISYISFMARIIKGEDPSTLRVSTYESQRCSSTQPSSHDALHKCEHDDFEDDRDDDEDYEEDTSDVDDEVIDEDSQCVYNQEIPVVSCK